MVWATCGHVLFFTAPLQEIVTRTGANGFVPPQLEEAQTSVAVVDQPFERTP